MGELPGALGLAWPRLLIYPGGAFAVGALPVAGALAAWAGDGLIATLAGALAALALVSALHACCSRHREGSRGDSEAPGA